MFPGKGVRKRCRKFTGEHPCRSVISIKLLCNFIEITLRHRCFPVNLLHIFRTPFLKNTSVRLLHENNYRPVSILPNISKIHESLFIWLFKLQETENLSRFYIQRLRKYYLWCYKMFYGFATFFNVILAICFFPK